jgi:hypothetical protein
MHQDESLREELVAEVKAIAPVLVEHSSEPERFGRLDAPTYGSPAQHASLASLLSS